LPTWRILCDMSRFLAIAPDPQCLQQAAAGDRSARRQVYELSAGPVFALIRRLVRGRAAAEDVFQDCMISLLDHLGDYRGEAPFGAWVRQVATRQCLMHLRSPWQRARRALRGSVHGESGDSDFHAAAAVGAMEAAHELPLAELIDLERALARLPDTARTVVWLHDAEGLRHEEIAVLFGRSVSFSKSQLARAHALLRAELGEPVIEPAPVAADHLAAQGHLP
jgi:RNA polymerase sigma factor (sigma-70 family)